MTARLYHFSTATHYFPTMTEDQKTISLILDLLNSSRGIPRTLVWIESEVKHAGRRAEVPAILEQMTDANLVESQRDAIKIRRWTITAAGKEALAEL